MRKPPSFASLSLSLFLGLLMLYLSANCGGSGGGGGEGAPPTTGSVITTISDPPTCLIPKGPFENAWVTITRVRAHTSSTAGPNDSGWVDLVDLSAKPLQIDLLSLFSDACLLNQLGSKSGVPAGTYQQIRIHLLTNSPGAGAAVPASNACGPRGFNCVVLASGTTQLLLLSSEAQTGIKIPSEEIAGNGFIVSGNQSTNLHIDFDACSSLVRQADGQFRLKPVLHAGAIPLNDNSISGTVVDALNNRAIQNAIVLIEQRDPNNPNIDRIVAQTTTGPQGDFIVCPLPAGKYDVVIAAETPNLVIYNATVTLQVPLGTAMGNISLVPEGIVPATVSGQITTTHTSGLTTTADLNVSALQPIGSLLVTIPALGNSTPNVTSENGSATYSLVLPASNPKVGTFSASPSTDYALPVAGPAVYRINAQAFNPMSSSLNPGSADCNSSSQFSDQLLLGSGDTATQNFAFAGCQ